MNPYESPHDAVAPTPPRKPAPSRKLAWVVAAVLLVGFLAGASTLLFSVSTGKVRATRRGRLPLHEATIQEQAGQAAEANAGQAKSAERPEGEPEATQND